jgi:hypothetical protein
MTAFHHQTLFRSPGRLPGFSLPRRLVADALPARDPAAVVPFDRGSLHAAALSWTDGDTAWTDTNCGVGVITPTIPIVAVVAVFVVAPGLHIDLGHLDALGLDRSDEGAVVSTPAATTTKAIFIMGSPPWT